MATLKEWDATGVILLELSVIRVIDESEIAWFNDQMILAGASGVEKPGKLSALGLVALRFIMDVRMANALFQIIDGDLGCLAGGPSMLRATILPGETALFSAEDLVVSFYLAQMPRVWHRYFTFRMQVTALAPNLEWMGVST